MNKQDVFSLIRTEISSADFLIFRRIVGYQTEIENGLLRRNFRINYGRLWADQSQRRRMLPSHARALGQALMNIRRACEKLSIPDITWLVVDAQTGLPSGRVEQDFRKDQSTENSDYDRFARTQQQKVKAFLREVSTCQETA